MDNVQSTDSVAEPATVAPSEIVWLARSHPEIVRDFEASDCFDAASVFAGLLTIPMLQARCLRLESLVHLAVAYAKGSRPLEAEVANTAFVELGQGACGVMEDPAEEVFSTIVTSSRDNHRLLPGIWESAAFFLQRTVNITERLPTDRGWEQLSESVFALLALSDAVCRRCGFGRATLGAEVSAQRLPAGDLADIRNRVVFGPADLDALGIRTEAIEPFVFDPSFSTLIPSLSVHHSPLLDHPLLRSGDRVVLALPTAVSVAVRRLVFGALIRAGFDQEAIGLLEGEYRRLWRHRSLFGVGRDVPVLFRPEGECQVATYGADIEPGRFIQFVFVLDRLRGFEKDGFIGEAPSEPAPGFIADTIAAYRGYAERSGCVKEGVTLVVSCGIGRASSRVAPRLSSAADDWDVVSLSARTQKP